MVWGRSKSPGPRPGWAAKSPITQLSFYAAFRFFGQRLGSARLVTVVWFLLLLTVFAVAMRKRYGHGLILLGLVLILRIVFCCHVNSLCRFCGVSPVMVWASVKDIPRVAEKLIITKSEINWAPTVSAISAQFDGRKLENLVCRVDEVV